MRKFLRNDPAWCYIHLALAALAGVFLLLPSSKPNIHAAALLLNLSCAMLRHKLAGMKEHND